MVIKDPASEGIALSKWTRNTLLFPPSTYFPT